MTFASFMGEDFNISPQFQSANQSGPDQGMTTGEPTETFPYRSENAVGALLPGEVQITFNKKDAKKLCKILSSISPKEKQAK
jgi:hypothetical protein